jgi:predicted NAD-dependent protein-ADP-ribosyltransferase YbiA (DUF1768 family)
MMDGCILKFVQNPKLRQLLIATDTATIVESNTFDLGKFTVYYRYKNIKEYFI